MRSYHERTKHRFDRYAASLGFLDWESQPDPFLRFAGAQRISLKRPEDDTPAFSELLAGRVERRPLNLSTLSGFFYYSLALSAWKQYRGERWALRVNPSSGNLHPTEGYLAGGPLEGLGKAGVFHYAPKEHELERRCEWTEDACKEFSKALPEDAFIVGLSSIHWREAWKYGERAYRYCQHDAGHALAALRYAAAIYGWEAETIDGISDSEIAAFLGLDRGDGRHAEEREEPDLLLAVYAGGGPGKRPEWAPGMFSAASAGHWSGKAGRLSEHHVPWEAIEAAAEATRARERAEAPEDVRARTPVPKPSSAEGGKKTAGEVVRSRRSVQVMDGETGISRDVFYRILERTLPNKNALPFDCAAWTGYVHFALFVHRVAGIPPGLYAMARREERVSFLKENLAEDFDWEKPPGAPESLPLYRLKTGDSRALAAELSCRQRIASDGAFSLGMIAEFDGPLQAFGPAFYRRLFWETGMIGQVLYLEAEAFGLQGTGIGCFFDDPVHSLFGVRDKSLQSLYHFTIGGGLHDDRLQSLPAYAHLDGKC